MTTFMARKVALASLAVAGIFFPYVQTASETGSASPRDVGTVLNGGEGERGLSV
jgi:hypothetical protein